MKKASVCIMLCLCAASFVYGLRAEVEIGGAASTETAIAVTPVAGITLSHQGGGFRWVGEIEARRDGTYSSPDMGFHGVYILMRQGGVSYESGAFKARAGKFAHYDIIDSPYSLFVSSKGNSALLGEISFDDGAFFFNSRTMALNWNSALYRAEVPVTGGGGGTISVPLDRGAVFKTYGVRFLDKFRFAYEEATVFTGRAFDAEFFLSPVPGFFVQYINSALGNPSRRLKLWGEPDDCNFIMGFLLDYDDGDSYGYVQLLVDDINTNRFFNPSGPQNPDKVAMSLGGRHRFDFGTLGLYAAAATKYTFSAVLGETIPSSSTGSAGGRYSYTYWPSTWFDKDGIRSPIDSEDNYIGYINGENNLAVSATYANRLNNLSFRGSLEGRIAGSSSPANPWHNLVNWFDGGQGPKFLDEARLETRLTFAGGVSLDSGPWTLYADCRLGYVWNKLQLVDSTEGYLSPAGMPYWAPSTVCAPMASVGLGVKYRLDITKTGQ